jgi:hypothetical protein
MDWRSWELSISAFRDYFLISSIRIDQQDAPDAKVAVRINHLCYINVLTTNGQGLWVFEITKRG